MSPFILQQRLGSSFTLTDDSRTHTDKVYSRLSGNWMRESDTSEVVEILNGRVMWPTHYDCPPTNIELLLDSSVQLLLENRVHRGFLEDALDEDGNRSIRLKWDDGDVWLRRE
eukprot:CAMPEP_0194498696 /NCGR_PEP_ID=MMETSP0253-20130528/15255_1 /TAXON_ID=2966 /ORGANISM="Noctiluca scintillans" /LENGTH=112 /DNA_ID=CAMNT_0039340373 /DNA_START=112 /DNA_END=450 /DNA_ORIENTATION=-